MGISEGKEKGGSKDYIQKSNTWDSTVDKTLALHASDSVSIPSTQYGSSSPTRIDPWALLGMHPPKKKLIAENIRKEWNILV